MRKKQLETPEHETARPGCEINTQNTLRECTREAEGHTREGVDRGKIGARKQLQTDECGLCQHSGGSMMHVDITECSPHTIFSGDLFAKYRRSTPGPDAVFTFSQPADVVACPRLCDNFSLS